MEPGPRRSPHWICLSPFAAVPMAPACSGEPIDAFAIAVFPLTNSRIWIRLAPAEHPDEDAAADGSVVT